MDGAKMREAGRLVTLLFAAALALDANTANAAVEISTRPTANMTCSGGVCTPTAKKAVLNVADLTDMLANGDAVVKSTKQNSNIEIDATLSWTSNNRLTLDASQSIKFNKPVVVIGAGALTVITGKGDFKFLGKGRIKFSDLKSSLVINGDSYVLAESIPQIKRLIHRGQCCAFHIALAKDIDASEYNGGTLHFAPEVLEGLGNTISNLTISDNTDQDSVGLFEWINEVRDIGLVNANITGSGANQNVGAIVGRESGTIEYSFVTGNISATGAGSRVGGLAGYNDGTIERSWSGASITAGANAAAGGGVAGENDGTINGGVLVDCYATGTVTGSDNGMVGGLVGYNLAGSIDDSYATGPVIGGKSSFVGGLVGADDGRTEISYSTGLVTGGSSAMVGGLIGEDIVRGTIETYWDLDTSGISDPSQGTGNIANDPGITGLSDAQLKSGLPPGFDKKVWKQSAAINNGYPYLIDNPPR
jgi:hypothetical protein